MLIPVDSVLFHLRASRAGLLANLGLIAILSLHPASLTLKLRFFIAARYYYLLDCLYRWTACAPVFHIHLARPSFLLALVIANHI